MLGNVFGFEKRSTKALIVSILCEEFPLSTTEIYSRVKTQGFRDLTYQAIYKVLKELMAKGLVEKNLNAYKLNALWIQALKANVEKLEGNYAVKISKPSYLMNALCQLN